MNEFFITTPVGNGQLSNPDDVLRTRDALNTLNIEAGESDRPYIDRKLDSGIRQFQRENNLKEDGYLKPSGETERALKHLLEEKKGIESEALPPLLKKEKMIPDTDILDRGIPEQGFPNSKRFDPFAPPRNSNPDPEFDKKPPNTGRTIEIERWKKFPIDEWLI